MAITSSDFVDRHDIRPGNGQPEEIDVQKIDQSLVDDFRATFIDESDLRKRDEHAPDRLADMYISRVHDMARDVSTHMNLEASWRFFNLLYSRCSSTFDSVLCHDRTTRAGSALIATPAVRTTYADRLRKEIEFIAEVDPVVGGALRTMMDEGKIRVANWDYPAPALVDPRTPDTIVLMSRLFITEPGDEHEEITKARASFRPRASSGPQMHNSSRGLAYAKDSRDGAPGRDISIAETLVHEYRHITQFNSFHPSNAHAIDAEHTKYCGVNYEAYAAAAGVFRDMSPLDVLMFRFITSNSDLWREELDVYDPIRTAFSRLRPAKTFKAAFDCRGVTQNYPDLDPRAPERFRGYYYDLLVFRDLSAMMMTGISVMNGATPPVPLDNASKLDIQEAATREGLHRSYRNAFEQTEAEAVAVGGSFVMAVEARERSRQIDALLAAIGVVSLIAPTLFMPRE